MADEVVKLMNHGDKNRRDVEPDGVAESQGNLAAYVEARREMGFNRMLENFVFEAPDPFKPNERRKARKGFVVTVFFSTAFIGWFAWFNLIR